MKDVTEVRVRWIGHRLHAEVNVAVDPKLSVEAGHVIAKEVRHQLLHHLTYLSNAVIHVDPLNASGEEHHFVSGHDYGDLTRTGIISDAEQSSSGDSDEHRTGDNNDTGGRYVNGICNLSITHKWASLNDLEYARIDNVEEALKAMNAVDGVSECVVETCRLDAVER